MPSIINRQRLASLASPDANIHDKQSSDPKLYRAIKNLGDAINHLINGNFPPPPNQAFDLRFTIAGSPAVANDVLSYHYHVVMPIDPLKYWTYSNVSLDRCYLTVKLAPAGGVFSIDIKKQIKGTTTWKSLFQDTFNPKLQNGKFTSHNTMFAIDQLLQGDLVRIDILASDGVVSGIELALIGNYVLTEN